MTPDLDRLEELANAANEGGWYGADIGLPGEREEWPDADVEFVAACSPQTVLWLVGKAREADTLRQAITDAEQKIRTARPHSCHVQGCMHRQIAVAYDRAADILAAVVGDREGTDR